MRAVDHLQKGEDVSVEGAALRTNESDSDGDELDILKDAKSDEGDAAERGDKDKGRP